jgi:hypothetical protein
MPGLQMAPYQQSDLPDPFVTYRRIDNIVCYPDRNNNNDIKFVVDRSKRGARVQAALSDATNLFAYIGTIKEPDGLWKPTKWMPLFKDALSEEEQQSVAKMLVRKQLPIDALLKVASPASFGKGGETVFDLEIRKAFEIPRSQLPNDLLDVLKISSIKEVEERMKPVLKKWTYHLYKIHMYGPGGKFEDHVDTLHQSNHVATVVLSLPSKHVGGILRIGHHGEVMEFDSSKGPTKDRYSRQRNLPYGAFFTDCTHSVQEVTSGWRVVVQYDVYEEAVTERTSEVEETDSDDEEVDIDTDEEVDIDTDEEVDIDTDDESDEDIDEESDEDEEYDETLERVVECLYRNRSVGTTHIHDKEQTELMQAVSQYMATIPSADGVAFFLRHRYSLPALNEVVLKGADRSIYDAFSKRGDLSISVKGVLVYYRNDDHTTNLQIKVVSMKDFFPDDVEEEKVDPSSTNSAVGPVHFIVDQDNSAERVNSANGEYTGNEIADDYNSYFAACMIIRSVDEERSSLESADKKE